MCLHYWSCTPFHPCIHCRCSSLVSYSFTGLGSYTLPYRYVTLDEALEDDADLLAYITKEGRRDRYHSAMALKKQYDLTAQQVLDLINSDEPIGIESVRKSLDKMDDTLYRPRSTSFSKPPPAYSGASSSSRDLTGSVASSHRSGSQPSIYGPLTGRDRRNSSSQQAVQFPAIEPARSSSSRAPSQASTARPPSHRSRANSIGHSGGSLAPSVGPSHRSRAPSVGPSQRSRAPSTGPSHHSRAPSVGASQRQEGSVHGSAYSARSELLSDRGSAISEWVSRSSAGSYRATDSPSQRSGSSKSSRPPLSTSSRSHAALSSSGTGSSSRRTSSRSGRRDH